MPVILLVMGGLPDGPVREAAMVAGDSLLSPGNSDPTPSLPEMIANSTLAPIVEKALGAPAQSASSGDIFAVALRFLQGVDFSWDGVVSDSALIGERRVY